MKKFVSALLLSIVVLGPSAAVAQERKDLQVFNDIVGQVNRYTQLTVFDSISASVDEGRVVLSGWVTMPYKRDDIERRVRKVAGVAAVDNKINVLPASNLDDELRFRNYANMINPPIRIVVNRGRVILEGVVQSNVERQLARSLASGFGEFEVKNALKTDAEVREELERISN
jgi:osmotically-inducible protein OsmY